MLAQTAAWIKSKKIKIIYILKVNGKSRSLWNCPLTTDGAFRNLRRSSKDSSNHETEWAGVLSPKDKILSSLVSSCQTFSTRPGFAHVQSTYKNTSTPKLDFLFYRYTERVRTLRDWDPEGGTASITVTWYCNTTTVTAVCTSAAWSTFYCSSSTTVCCRIYTEW